MVKMKRVLAMSLVCAMSASVLLQMADKGTSKAVTAYAADDRRAEIEKSLYNAEYYAKANEDVAVALNDDEETLYNHWLDSIGVTVVTINPAWE